MKCIFQQSLFILQRYISYKAYIACMYDIHLCKYVLQVVDIFALGRELLWSIVPTITVCLYIYQVVPLNRVHKCIIMFS